MLTYDHNLTCDICGSTDDVRLIGDYQYGFVCICSKCELYNNYNTIKYVNNTSDILKGDECNV